ncbi:sensor histidine kinase [Culicoidibacter larvae]|uniref:histidine kinase n=1 Tax=Culicoidibacter larvae TaxID=2579976 RepID=A0A5R8QJH1_9FIRM|nr:sensor histidine kinase [Culicoidibacter larvae]TLG77407.1 HAMP domain-containing histidine kinase [Culicoidibacter larvae]
MTLATYFRSRFLFLIAIVFIIAFTTVYSIISGMTPTFLYLMFVLDFGLISVVVVDFARCIIEARKLQKIADSITETTSLTLPETSDAYSKVYQQIIQNTFAQTAKQTEKLHQKIDHDADYYTTWIHQIKTPITATRLILDTNRNIENERIFLQLEQEVDKIEQYATMALYYSRLNDFHQDYAIAAVDLGEMTKMVTKKLANIFIYKNIRIENNAADLQVYSDKKWLEFIIEQITTNALKYTSKGGTITFATAENDHEITFSISDTGIGISSVDLPRVFQRSFTGSAGRKVQNTSGIGLYMCATLAQKLGHQLTIESAVGVGTTLTIHFNKNSKMFD